MGFGIEDRERLDDHVSQDKAKTADIVKLLIGARDGRISARIERPECFAGHEGPEKSSTS